MVYNNTKTVVHNHSKEICQEIAKEFDESFLRKLLIYWEKVKKSAFMIRELLLYLVYF